MNRTTLLKGLAIVVLALAALVAGLLLGRPATQAPPQDRAALERLLNLQLPDPDGKPQSLAQWRGKTLVINFWATWCPPCKEEMPLFSRLQAANQAQGVQFVGIAVDSADNVREFAARTPTTYPLLIGGNGSIELARDLGNRQMGLPFTLVVDAGGQLTASKLGSLGETELQALIDQARR